MIKTILRRAGAGLLIAALAGLPLPAAAQSNAAAGTARKPALQPQGPAAKQKMPHPFHGRLAAVDKTARTIRVGKSIYQLTSETRITKGGKLATLDDAVVGEETAGYVKPTEEGKLAAASVRFGPKPDGARAQKRKDKTPE